MAYEWRQNTPTRNTKYWCGNGAIPILERGLIDDVWHRTFRNTQKKTNFDCISNRHILRPTMFGNMHRAHLGYTIVFTLIGSTTILPAAWHRATLSPSVQGKNSDRRYLKIWNWEYLDLHGGK